MSTILAVFTWIVTFFVLSLILDGYHATAIAAFLAVIPATLVGVILASTQHTQQQQSKRAEYERRRSALGLKRGEPK